MSYARNFPKQPRETIDLIRGGFVAIQDVTFGSGTPFNDLAYTLFNVDYIDGETAGFDTSEPAATRSLSGRSLQHEPSASTSSSLHQQPPP